MTNQIIQPIGCPPSPEATDGQCGEPFNPEPWQNKEVTWRDKIFVKDHVTSFFHIPLNMGKGN